MIFYFFDFRLYRKRGKCRKAHRRPRSLAVGDDEVSCFMTDFPAGALVFHIHHSLFSIPGFPFRVIPASLINVPVTISLSFLPPYICHSRVSGNRPQSTPLPLKIRQHESPPNLAQSGSIKYALRNRDFPASARQTGWIVQMPKMNFADSKATGQPVSLSPPPGNWRQLPRLKDQGSKAEKV